jgi:hypothetical protein
MPRIRPEGGVVGLNNTPTLATATGMWTMQDVARNLRNSTWPLGAGAADPYFNLNALLIHADSTNGKTNTSYIDSSPNVYTATASGRPYQGTASPFSLTGWSNLFNGSTGYLNFPANSGYDITSGDFALECWIFRNTSGVEQYLFSNRAASSGWELRINATNLLQFFFTAGSSLTSTGTIPSNSWVHIAVTRQSNTVRIFINGALDSSATFANGSSASSTVLYLANGTTGGGLLNGYMSNARIVKGNAIYTAAFTPSSTALTAIAGTTLLTCQSNRFLDASTNVTMIPTGAPTVESFSPFNPAAEYSTTTVGGSAYFNGTTDYITLPNNMTALGNAAYTLEGWFYPTTVAAAEIPIVKLYNATQTIELRIVSSKLQGRINNSATIVGGNSTLYPNQWYHFALVKPTAGTSTAVLYINGVAEATTTSDTTTYTAFTTPRIGANQTPNIYYTGWASNVRFIRTVAQYTSNFTPPTAPFTSGSELFLLNFTNAGIIDQTSKNNLATLGSAAVSTTQSKFGGSSFFINDGDSNLATIPHNKLLNLDSGNFTIEFWVYLTQNASSYNFIISKGTSGTREWAVNVGPGTIRFYWSTNGSSTGDSTYSVTPASIPLSTWMHIAVVRSSTNLYIFKDGTQVGSTGTFTSMYVGTNVVNIGRFMDFTGIGHSMFGYIDDLRITKYARYTANFTPSTIAFADR